jgi:hypothetical protein
MHQIQTEIEIESTPDRVWSTLIDFPSHSTWNPFIRSIKGIPEKGERLVAFIQPPVGRGMTFRPTVLTAIPHQELRWLGRFLFPGLFDGEHYFQIVTLADNRVKFIHGEMFSGIMVPLAKSSLEGPTKAGFNEMNQALKSRVESHAS